MMISPKSFAESFKEEKLETCMKEKDKLEKSIKKYEETHQTRKIFLSKPEDIMYKCDKLYLNELNKIIKKKAKEA